MFGDWVERDCELGFVDFEINAKIGTDVAVKET